LINIEVGRKVIRQQKGMRRAIMKPYGEPMPPPSSWSFKSQIEIYAIKK
jgi:hypothetical protein